MALYLVQHGKSLSKEVDPERGLSEEGTDETKRIAGVAEGYEVEVSSILHSGKKRARQTAEIFSAALVPRGGVREREGLQPLDDVTVLAGEPDLAENIMLVGHLPFMERLASFLITGYPEKPVFLFQNSGLVCLDKDRDTGFWAIQWALMPHVGRK